MPNERLEHPNVFERLMVGTIQLRTHRRIFRDQCTQLNKMNGTGEPIRQELRKVLERWADGQSRTNPIHLLPTGGNG